MKTISLAVLAALSIAALGCKKHGADCEGAIAHGMELSKADMQKHPGMDEKTMQKLEDIGVQRCKEDKWPGAALACMVEAKTETDAQACYSKLTPDQQAKMNAAAWGGAAGGAAGAGSAAGDWGSAAGAGSAMGSAEAGGAMGSAGNAEAGSAEAGSAMGSAGSAAAPK